MGGGEVGSGLLDSGLDGGVRPGHRDPNPCLEENRYLCLGILLQEQTISLTIFWARKFWEFWRKMYPCLWILGSKMGPMFWEFFSVKNPPIWAAHPFIPYICESPPHLMPPFSLTCRPIGLGLHRVLFPGSAFGHKTSIFYSLCVHFEILTIFS